MRLEGHAAVVTGGSRGIGRGIALGLAREGAQLIVNYVAHHAKADEVVEEIERGGGRAWAICADISRKEEVDRLMGEAVSRMGRVDVVVNNAGAFDAGDFLDVDEETLDRVLGVNFKGPFFMAQAAARQMRKQGGGGKIINIISATVLRPDPGVAVYASSKAAAHLLTKTLAQALAPDGICVNAVLPGVVETDLNYKLLQDEEIHAQMVGQTPLGRFGRPADLAGVVTYLASAESDWTTGATISVDGGFTI